MKRALSMMLACVLMLALAIPAIAVDTGFRDVPADADYAQAVAWCRENGVMSGTSSTTFNPDGTLTRAMVAAVLYRWKGSPAVSSMTTFSDNQAGAYYHDAAIWAAEHNILAGYGDGRFGPNDPVNRQQLATFLWRHSGGNNTSAASFADRSDVASYAVTAVDWAVSNNIIALRAGNRFAPAENATRAEVASALYAYLGKNETPAQNGKILVAYYSAQGHTKAVAEAATETLNADTLELIPVEPYSSEDLNWTVDGSRVNREHENESLRDVKLTNATVNNWDEYDVILIGYPIWWGIAAWPVNDFVNNNDFTGKTVIPFCTSASSGLGQSGELLAEMAGTGNWQTGQRFREGASTADVRAWANGLDLPKASAQTTQNKDSKVLVAYFSMPDNVDDSTVNINGQTLGNNQYFAQVIQEATGVDVFRIEAATPYPTDHATLVDQASKEQNENARPAIKDAIQNFDQYDTVFVGYPIWWSDMPQIMYTFFDTYDFSGKTLIPFGTHGGSGWAGTPAKIAQLEPSANMLDGLSISRNSIENAHDQIVQWVSSLTLQ